jgi:hypothetical protein
MAPRDPSFFDREGGFKWGHVGPWWQVAALCYLTPLRGLPPHRRLPAVLLGASCGRTARCGLHWFSTKFNRGGFDCSSVRLPHHKGAHMDQIPAAVVNNKTSGPDSASSEASSEAISRRTSQASAPKRPKAVTVGFNKRLAHATVIV